MLAPVPRRACSSTCSLNALRAAHSLSLSPCTSSLRNRSSLVTTIAFPSSAFTASLSLSPSIHRKSFHSTRPTSSQSQPSRISYRVAVSSSGKGRRFHPLKNAYNFDPTLTDVVGVSKDKNPVSRRRSRPDSGEDAFFVSRIGTGPSPDANRKPDSEFDSEPKNQHRDQAVAFAVADGVGGWTESKVDPADFSHGLCAYMAQSALSWTEPPSSLRPKNLLQSGYDCIVADPAVKAGGSTASVGVALPDGRVELANLGDSGSVLLRRAAVHTYSTPQTHGFNTPYQLSIIPPRMRAQANIFGGGYLEDFPRDAAVTNLHMQHGDVLMLATDGVFDNLNNQDILKIVSSRMVATGAWTAEPEVGVGISDSIGQLTMAGGLAHVLSAAASSGMASSKESEELKKLESTVTLQSLLAASISGEAKMASVDFRRDGPFAKEAQRYYPGDHYHGGKVDDITTLILVAVDEALV